MKSVHKVLLAGIFVLSLVPLQVHAASLLGGLIKTGSDSGNSNSIVSLGGNGGSIGVLGTDGVSVSLPVAGSGSGASLPLNLGSSTVGVPGVASITSSPATGGGSTVGLSLLGGGGGTLSTNPIGLLGTGGLNVTLPGLGGVIPGGGGGTNGTNGTNGANGTNGGVVITYLNNGGGGDGGSFAIPSGISSRLQALLRMLAERDYLRLSNGRAVCLNAFGTAEVSNWIPKKDWGALQQVLATYAQDIYTLRQLLANCRDSAQRQALNLTNLNRVIGIDIGSDGRPILFML